MRARKQLPLRKPKTVPRPVALGYLDTAKIPAGYTIGEVGLPMRVRADEWGFDWGGTHVDMGTHRGTVAALTRAATINPTIHLVVVPDENHFPDGQHDIDAGSRRIPVLTADSATPPWLHDPEQDPARGRPETSRAPGQR